MTPVNSAVAHSVSALGGRVLYFVRPSTFALLLAVACAPKGVATAPRIADDAGAVAKDAKLLAMADTRVVDTLLIDALLSDTDNARRARAALAIGQTHAHARYARLKQLLVDGDTGVAASAAFALGLVRDSSAVTPLGRALAGAPDAVAIEAAWALGEIGESSRTLLGLALGEGSAQPLASSTAAQRSPMVRASLLLALSKLNGVQAKIVAPWLSDPSVDVVRAAAYTLARTRVAAGVRFMLPLRSHADDEVRQYVAREIARAASGDSFAQPARDALRALADDRNPLVRANAIRSLATYGPLERIPLQRAIADADKNVRVAAAQLLGPVLGADAASWRAAWQSDTNYIVRRSLLESARQAGSDALLTGETEWSANTDWRMRAAVVDARAGDPNRAVQTFGLATALRDKDGRVRAAAVAALVALPRGETRNADSARAWLRTYMTDEDVQVRAATLGAVAGVVTAGDVHALLDAYTRGVRDRDPDARQAAMQAVSAAWQRDSARVDLADRERIASLPVPRDANERVVASRIGPLVSWRAAGTANAAKPMAEYEKIARRFLQGSSRIAHAVIRTERGDITVELFGADAPMTVDNFMQVAARGEYGNTRFHRVIPAFVAQDGDPRGDGSGGPGYAIRDELNRQRHARGSIAMALSGPDTGGSQYYLCHTPQPHLDGHYTVFGKIIGGFDTLDRIVQGDRIISVEVKQ